MMLGHHLGNVAATVWLARSAQAQGPSATVAGALVAACPVMLFEIGMGHTLTAAVWPGLLALAFLVRGQSTLAGLLIGLQGLCYLYTGLAFGIAAVLLRPRKGLAAAFVIIVPYLWWLSPQMPASNAMPPPAGHTSLPLDGLMWLSQQHQFRIHPALLVGFFAPVLVRRNRRQDVLRWWWVALLALFLALGPTPSWIRGTPLLTSPLLFILEQVPGLSRMHHPIRFAMLLIPAMAVLTALVLDRWPKWVAGLSLLLVIPTWRVMDDAVGWRAQATPPGMQAAQWVGQHGKAVVDLGSRSMEGLALQPVHKLPLMAGFHPRQAPPPHVDPTLMRRVNAWADGVPQKGLPAQLRAQGFTHVLVIDRGPAAPIEPTAVESALGPPVFPGVYAL